MDHPKKERTLVIIKPDGVQRGLVGDIIKRFEQTGLKLVGLKFIIPTEDLCLQHYQKDNIWYQEKGEITVKNRQDKGLPIKKETLEYGKDIITQLVKFMTVGPVIPMVFEGNQAVKIVKKITGGTEPATSDVGTIRGDYTLDSYEISNIDERAVRNLIHCTGEPQESTREINLWFKKNELIDYGLIQDKILYDVNLDGIKE